MLQGPAQAAGPELEASAIAFGLVPPKLPEAPSIDVWAEHWPAVRVFAAMVTQLRCSFGGVVGFDYAALPVVEQRLGISPEDSAEIFDSLRVMERELIAWHRG